MFGFAHWSLYWISGVLAILCSWVFSGCRVGNRVQAVTDADQISGYYELQSNTFNVCASLVHSNNNSCKPMTTNQIPESLASVLTQPVALQVLSFETGRAALYDPLGDKMNLPIFVDPDSKKLSVLAQGEDDLGLGCKSQFLLEMSGQLYEAPSQKIRGIPTRGRMELDLHLSTTFSIDCKAHLQEQLDCYLDVNKCAGTTQSQKEAEQEAVKAEYNLYVRSGVLDMNDLPNLGAAGYEISYR